MGWFAFKSRGSERVSNAEKKAQRWIGDKSNAARLPSKEANVVRIFRRGRTASFSTN